MSETVNDHSSGPKISRRKFLELLFGSIPVATYVAREAQHEQELQKKNSFETDLAVWCPIYERHDQHEKVLSPANIPPDLDYLAMEGLQRGWAYRKGRTVEENIFQISLIRLLTARPNGFDTSQASSFRRFPDATLAYLSDHHIKVAFGDVAVDEQIISFEPAALTTLRKAIGLIILTAGSIGINCADEQTSQSNIERDNDVSKTDESPHEKKKNGISRRELIRRYGKAGLILGLSVLLPPFLRSRIHWRLMDSIQDNSPYQRLWARIHTLNGNMMPEYLNDFFREIVQANKLLTLAKVSKNSSTGDKLKIGYNWHLGHRGIEDWLRIDQEFVRQCILAFPDSVLRKIVELNNGDPRCLYAIRTAGIMSSLKIIEEDIQAGTMSYTYDENEHPVDMIIEDEILKEKLAERGIVGDFSKQQKNTSVTV